MTTTTESDIALIGAGIMSATLGTFLTELSPEKSITVFEKLPGCARESSYEWNNAGTGHAALCELNYTPEQADGSVTIHRAVDVNEKFQQSLQMWSYLVANNHIEQPREFIRQLPHMSFVQGKQNIQFLKTRYQALSQHPLFAEMQYSEDPDTLSQWIPLVMDKRPHHEPIAATRIESGTDVNFGSLTRKLFNYLANNGAQLNYHVTVQDLNRTADGKWELTILNTQTGKTFKHRSSFVFIGCGGGSLNLLHKSGIPEGKHIGGFPVSGLFMTCHNEQVIKRHFGKVYGRAKVGAPPMSVPHLDTRFIDGKQTLLFGPFAGFSPKFLKEGSALDLLSSVHTHNLTTIMAASVKNLPLTKYLLEQLLLSNKDRMQELREFIPDAKDEDWQVVTAGQRVQIIKDTENEKGALRFGTEVIHAADNSLAALLGASPGASTSVHVMLEVLVKCFPEHLTQWDQKLRKMIPSYQTNLSENATLLKQIKETAKQVLQLDNE